MTEPPTSLLTTFLINWLPAGLNWLEDGIVTDCWNELFNIIDTEHWNYTLVSGVQVSLRHSDLIEVHAVILKDILYYTNVYVYPINDLFVKSWPR